MIRKLTQPEIINYLNTCCENALELLELKELLESTGHILQSEAMMIYNINMLHFYHTNSIA